MEELEGYIERFRGKHFLLICDDLMSELAESSMAQDITTKLGHHRGEGISFIRISQNLFAPGKAARTQALNSQYYILTRTCRDLKQISVLGSQMFPGKSSQFVQAYKDAVDNPLTTDAPPHLLVSCHPLKTQRGCQLLSNIFPPGGRMVLYRLD
jgi:hypothetical protein